VNSAEELPTEGWPRLAKERDKARGSLVAQEAQGAFRATLRALCDSCDKWNPPIRGSVIFIVRTIVRTMNTQSNR